MKSTIKIFTCSILFFIGLQQLTAQKIIAKAGSGVEYKDDEQDLYDMNAITPPSNTVTITIKNKKNSKSSKVVQKVELTQQMEKLIKLKKRLRFRNTRRNEVTMCYRKAAKPCNTK